MQDLTKQNILGWSYLEKYRSETMLREIQKKLQKGI